jgi:hypothetical protein
MKVRSLSLNQDASTCGLMTSKLPKLHDRLQTSLVQDQTRRSLHLRSRLSQERMRNLSAHSHTQCRRQLHNPTMFGVRVLARAP